MFGVGRPWMGVALSHHPKSPTASSLFGVLLSYAFHAVVVVVVVAFSSPARILAECLTIHSPPELFFFFKVEISSRTLITLFRPWDQSTVAQRAETTVT